MRTAGGKASFAVLLFQDIAVLPILALLPLLATVNTEPGRTIPRSARSDIYLRGNVLSLSWPR